MTAPLIPGGERGGGASGGGGGFGAGPAPRVAILGAGPVGLDAALAAREAGFPFTVYEAGDRVASSMRSWGHVRLFSPWSMDVSSRMRAHLASAGIRAPEGEACPTGRELVDRVLEPVAALDAVGPRLRMGTRVVAVGRERLLKDDRIGDPARADHPFRLLLEDGWGERVDTADVVLDCTGTWDHPNALGSGGIPAPGERAAARRIVRRIPPVPDEPEAWRRCRVLLVGAGHSAQTVARDLAELAAASAASDAPRVVWAVRSEAPDWGAVDDDPLRERARLSARARELASGASPAVRVRTGVVVDELRPDGDAVGVALADAGGATVWETVDRVLALTGSVGDHLLYRQLQVHECYATSGPMKLAAALLAEGGGSDCLEAPSPGPQTLVNPEPGFFLLGSKSYGRNNTFLLREGWRQVSRVFGRSAPGDGGPETRARREAEASP